MEREGNDMFCSITFCLVVILTVDCSIIISIFSANIAVNASFSVGQTQQYIRLIHDTANAAAVGHVLSALVCGLIFTTLLLFKGFSQRKISGNSKACF